MRKHEGDAKPIPHTFADLDRIRAERDAADPLKPGMWQLKDANGTRSGVMREDWCDVMDRAAAKFGGPAPADEPIRYASALVMARQG